MKISYQATIDDFVEPTLRHYLRADTTPRSRFLAALFSAILGGAACSFGYSFIGTKLAWPIALLGALIGVVSSVVGFEGNVARRLRRHFLDKYPGRFPADTAFEIDGTALKCTCLDATIVTSLYDLVGTREDRKYLEINFGRHGLSTIPQRAFPDPAEKAAFLQALTAGQTQSRGLVENFKSL